MQGVKNRPIVFLSTHPSGGIRELWINLAEGFRLAGEDARLVAFYPAPSQPAGTGAIPWHHFLPARPRGAKGQLELLGAIARWLRRERPHAIVTAMPAANAMVPILARMFSPATRIITSHHSPVETHSPVFNALDGLAGSLSNVAAVVSVSEAVSQSLSAKSSAYLAKRRVIHNALPPAIETMLDGMAPPLPRERPLRRRLVATGRLAYQKNYPMLLDAMARLADVELDIVGVGPDEADLRAQAARLGLSGRVHFHGFMPREDALSILAKGDAFVQVSRFEGHSLGLIEAARVGLPLVVSDIPVQIEAITARDGERCGVAVPLDDPGALALAIERLLGDSAQYGEWSALSRRIAEEAGFADVMRRYGDVIG